MNAQSFARRSLVIASLFAALAAPGCVVSGQEDLEDEDYNATEEAAATTAASQLTDMAKNALEKAAGPMAGVVVKMVMSGLGIGPKTSISQESMDKIAELVGTKVRDEFRNVYEAELNAAQMQAGEYSRTCTSGCPQGLLNTLQERVSDIINQTSSVSSYYQLDQLAEDRLTVAPQLINAMALKTTFMLERYQLYRLQNPNGDNRPHYVNACKYANSSVNVMDDVEQQFNDFIKTEVTEIRTHQQARGGKVLIWWSYKVGGDTVESFSRTTIEEKRTASIAKLRNEILSANFNRIRNQLRTIGMCGFEWSHEGPIAGKTCVQINEPSEQSYWKNNYLCSNVNFGVDWSHEGKKAGRKCTLVNEPGDPNGWNNNYLCTGQNSPLEFEFSNSFGIAGKSCVRMYEPSDPHTWKDNYICLH